MISPLSRGSQLLFGASYCTFNHEVLLSSCSGILAVLPPQLGPCGCYPPWPPPEWFGLCDQNKLATTSTVSAPVALPDMLLCWVWANCRRAVRSPRDSGNCVPSCSPPVQICSRKYLSPYLWKTRVDSFLAVRTLAAKVDWNTFALASLLLTDITLLSDNPDKRLKVYSPAGSFLSPRLKSNGILALIGLLSCAFADATAAQRVNIETRLSIVSLLITFPSIQSPICFRRAAVNRRPQTAPTYVYLFESKVGSLLQSFRRLSINELSSKPNELLSPSAAPYR